MPRIFLFFVLLVTGFKILGQTAPEKYWVQFTDKNNSPYSLDNPAAFLSPKCIERRLKFSIGFDDLDIPVNQFYIDEILNLGNCSLHHRSKWFNAITISTADTLLVEEIEAMPFVHHVKSLKGAKKVNRSSEDKLMTYAAKSACTTCDDNPFSFYGHGLRQIQMLNGHLLHELGFRGEGVSIAQFDAGWTKTDSLAAFQQLRDEGRIVLVRDMVNHNGDSIYNLSNHGTFVLSTMASWWPDSLVGTAPHADYYLFRTEDPGSEFLVEEDNWVAAAEICDSLGLDIINSSLGYSLFDDSLMNHVYQDMDGNTTRCSIAADIASEKGILVVNSAGNSGDAEWHFITAPSDGDHVLCVGAVDAFGDHAAFSGYGPSSDGDVKPDVVTMGKATSYADLDGTVSTGNGTSFSSPILAGMAACLYQAFPDKSNFEIADAIRRSATKYFSPNDSTGYGIPDLMKAMVILQGSTQANSGDFFAMLFPNPCNTQLTAVLFDEARCDVEYEIYDAVGRRIFEGKGIISDDTHGILRLDHAILPLVPGNYTLHLGRAGRHSVLHFQKMKS